MNQRIGSYETSVPESNFDQIYIKRINEIQEKVSKYCSNYDALMNLLPIGNQFSSLLNFQKDIENIESKIGSLNKKINSVNQYEVPIDKNFWQKQILNLKSMHTQNEKQIQKIHQEQKNKTFQFSDKDFELKTQQKIKNYEQLVTTKLANYKNKVQKERHKLSKQNYKQVFKSINQKIQRQFKPYHKQIDQLLQEIQICRLKIPLRNFKDFHDFNHQRLLQQIIYLNQDLQSLFEKLNHSKKAHNLIEINSIQKISNQIQSIKYQAIGNRKKCLNDILLYQSFQTGSENSLEKMEKYLDQSFQQLKEGLQQIQERLDLLQRYVVQS